MRFVEHLFLGPRVPQREDRDGVLICLEECMFFETPWKSTKFPPQSLGTNLISIEIPLRIQHLTDSTVYQLLMLPTIQRMVLYHAYCHGLYTMGSRGQLVRSKFKYH